MVFGAFPGSRRVENIPFESKMKVQRKMLKVGWNQCEGLITVQFMCENLLIIHDKEPTDTSEPAEENIQEQNKIVDLLKIMMRIKYALL